MMVRTRPKSDGRISLAFCTIVLLHWGDGSGASILQLETFSMHREQNREPRPLRTVLWLLNLASSRRDFEAAGQIQ